jgi:hypothetical protein
MEHFPFGGWANGSTYPLHSKVHTAEQTAPQKILKLKMYSNLKTNNNPANRRKNAQKSALKNQHSLKV